MGRIAFLCGHNQQFLVCTAPMKKRRKGAQTLMLTGMTSKEFLRFTKDVKHRVLEGVEEVPELTVATFASVSKIR